MTEITTTNRLTMLLGRLQAATGRRVTLRGLAAQASVPKDLVYRLDAGEARYVDLVALARLCCVLECAPQEILVWRDARAAGMDGLASPPDGPTAAHESPTAGRDTRAGAGDS
jgi:DNA-binding Xre family transcriptional regulator